MQDQEPFAKLMEESNIFLDRSALSPHFTPDTLLYRDKQINSIVKALTPSLKGDKGRNLFLYGAPGTGKTSCIKYVIDKVKVLPLVKSKISYMGCKIYNSRYKVLNKIMSDHMPTYAKRGYGITDIYEKLISWIDQDSKILIVVLDEIDMVKDLDDLIYTLTRSNSDVKSGGITTVGISNNVSFKEVLDPRSLSTLYETELAFPPYNSTELSDIIRQRAKKALKEGAIDIAAINYAAAIAAKENGDARLALKMLTKAGENAEDGGKSKIEISDIKEAAKSIESDIAYDLVAMLPEHQKLLLYAISLLSIQGGKYKKLSEEVNGTFLLSGEVYEKYASIASSLKKESKSSRWYRKYVSDLEMQGLIEMMNSGKGIRGQTKLIRLRYPAEKIKATIEQSLFNDSEQPSDQGQG
jgi:cell division control protein 6